MSSQPDPPRSRTAGTLAITGAACMIAGVALWIASGTDLDRALAEGTMGTYLSAVGDVPRLVVATLSVWILGVLLIAAAGSALSRLPVQRPLPALLGRMCFWMGAPLACVAFLAWLALVLHLPGADGSTPLVVAEVVGWFASRTAWIATALIVGVGPALLSFAGQQTWVPQWLAWWGAAAAAAALLTTIGFFPGGLTTYGSLILPVGLGWMLAAGGTVIRSRPASTDA